MLSRLIYLVKYFIFWLIFFMSLKALFMLYYYSESIKYSGDIIEVFLYGLKMDISVISYFMIMPILLIILSLFITKKWLERSIRLYTCIFVFIIAVFAVTDLILYKEWGFRLDTTPLLYLKKPKEAFASANIPFIILHFLLCVSITFLFILLFNRSLKISLLPVKNKVISLLLFVILLGSLIIPVRGGFGKSTINTGTVYFSEHDFMNHAAVNLIWNFTYSLLNAEVFDNPYKSKTVENPENYLNKLFYSSNESTSVLNNNRPNILIIILEGISYNSLTYTVESTLIAPRLNSIASKGILFTDFYASGDRTDKGLLAILSGFPAQSNTTLLKYPDKTRTIESFPKILRQYGYSCRFYYGGDLEFANYKPYLMNAGFNSFVTKHDFPKSERISNWGVPDGYLFKKLKEDLKTMSQPYLVSLITLSSHPPFDIPESGKFQGSNDEIKYCNSVYYADRCLGEFIDDLESADMLDNTLVIILSDHGNQHPGNLNGIYPERYHIPMIWYGGALKKTACTIPRISCQTDLFCTLSNQLNLKTTAFFYGKDIFAEEAAGKIIYSFNGGYGYVSDSLVYYYQLIPDKYTALKGEMQEEAIAEGTAFYQYLYSDIANR